MFVKHNNYNCLIACCLKRLKKHTLVVFGTTCVLGIWGIIVNGERLKEIAEQQHGLAAFPGHAELYISPQAHGSGVAGFFQYLL